MTEERTATIGDNNPPPYDVAKLEAVKDKARAFSAEAAVWIKKGEVESAEEAEQLNDVVAKGRQLVKGSDDLRKQEKKPHADAGKAVDDAFRVVLDALNRAVNDLKPIAAKWMQAEQAKQRAEAERIAREARQAEEEAARLAAQAARSNDAMAAAEAEQAASEAAAMQKQADKASKQKARVGSATGGGRTMALRTVKTANIENLNLVFRHFSTHPDVRDVLQRLATAAIRKGEDVPGATKDEQQVAA